MRRQAKQFLPALLAFCLLLSLVACGGDSGSSGGGPTDNGASGPEIGAPDTDNTSDSNSSPKEETETLVWSNKEISAIRLQGIDRSQLKTTPISFVLNDSSDPELASQLKVSRLESVGAAQGKAQNAMYFLFENSSDLDIRAELTAYLLVDGAPDPTQYHGTLIPLHKGESGIAYIESLDRDISEYQLKLSVYERSFGKRNNLRDDDALENRANELTDHRVYCNANKTGEMYLIIDNISEVTIGANWTICLLKDGVVVDYFENGSNDFLLQSPNTEGGRSTEKVTRTTEQEFDSYFLWLDAYQSNR